MSTDDYDTVIYKLRNFFRDNGYQNTYRQNQLDILAACEDPSTIGTFEYCGSVFPLPQTNQMRLEVELLATRSLRGIYCETTSYRAEPNPVPGRHDLVFPMFEFEAPGKFDDLLCIETALLRYLGFTGDFPVYEYEGLCAKFGVTDLTHEHERLICTDHQAAFVCHFPSRTSPFFNMKVNSTNADLFNKIDVIIGGMETIGSAERETDKVLMRKNFETISNGEYSKLLFSRFGKERVLRELDAFLSYDFFSRYGGGIGVTRLIKAMKKYKLL